MTASVAGAALALVGVMALPASADGEGAVSLALTGTVTASGQEVVGRWGPG